MLFDDFGVSYPQELFHKRKTPLIEHTPFFLNKTDEFSALLPPIVLVPTDPFEPGKPLVAAD